MMKKETKKKIVLAFIIAIALTLLFIKYPLLGLVMLIIFGIYFIIGIMVMLLFPCGAWWFW